MNAETIDWLTLLHDMADEADDIALRLYRATGLQIEEKSDCSPVTEADRAIEERARAVVSERCPEVAVFGEEFGEIAGSSEVRLIIDPIDSTRNFVRGIPIFATLLAIEVDHDVVAGVVSAPAMGMRWSAQRGSGAHSGSRRLRTSTIGTLAEAQLFHSNIGGTGEPGVPAGMLGLMNRVERTRGFGDFYQHMLVAEGAGEIAVDPVVKPWDIAPLQVIVEEAGGKATTLAGERTIYGGSLVTSNGVLHDETLHLLARFNSE
jgi:histidinol-phosphatase